jgi:hypothetical protein
VTLIVTLNTPETIWVLGDRRLTDNGRVVREDARKIMTLETRDGVALLAYAGLGATPRGTEPADWMSGVLRGRNLLMEESLGVLARAMKEQLPRHMVRMRGPGGPAHNLLIPAFVSGELRLYSIDLVFMPDRRKYFFRYTRHIIDRTIGTKKPQAKRVAISGSGGLHLLKRDPRWARDLDRLTRASDQRKVSQQTVADHLAALNLSVHRVDRLVGPKCIVVWRNRQGGVHGGGGGGQYYDGTEHDRGSSLPLPIIGCGMDITALIRVLRSLPTGMRVVKPTDKPEVETPSERLSDLPTHPDEQLR